MREVRFDVIRLRSGSGRVVSHCFMAATMGLSGLGLGGLLYVAVLKSLLLLSVSVISRLAPRLP